MGLSLKYNFHWIKTQDGWKETKKETPNEIHSEGLSFLAPRKGRRWRRLCLQHSSAGLPLSNGHSHQVPEQKPQKKQLSDLNPLLWGELFDYFTCPDQLLLEMFHYLSLTSYFIYSQDVYVYVDINVFLSLISGQTLIFSDVEKQCV